jgi:hypothetical protein
MVQTVRALKNKNKHESYTVKVDSKTDKEALKDKNKHESMQKFYMDKAVKLKQSEKIALLTKILKRINMISI